MRKSRRVKFDLAMLDHNQRRIMTGLSDVELTKPLKKIYDRVIDLTHKYPEVKGDYNLLVTRYQWYYHGRQFGISFDQLLRLESPESITRAFRKAVENGAIQPTGKIKARRAQRERAIRYSITKLGVKE